MRTSDTLLHALDGCEASNPNDVQVDASLLRRAIQGVSSTHPRAVICALIAAGEYGKIDLIANPQTSNALRLMVDGLVILLSEKQTIEKVKFNKGFLLHDELSDVVNRLTL